MRLCRVRSPERICTFEQVSQSHRTGKHITRTVPHGLHLRLEKDIALEFENFFMVRLHDLDGLVDDQVKDALKEQ